MKKFLFIVLLLQTACSDAPVSSQLAHYREQAARVTIIRDKWGIPHIYGKTDADAVFGLMYAQCEESFERLERNYIEKLGRMAEVEGPGYLYEDLKTKLLYDTSAAKADYNKSPAWLRQLLNAFADGINYYLCKHSETKPLLLTHFEPWFALMLTDGAYINTFDGGLQTKDMQNLYSFSEAKNTSFFNREKLIGADPCGSNGFALGPSKTASGNTMLYINPHVSFYFRMEAQVVSEEGLNAYGAVTWGEFFIFQGFNEHCGWMHTSSLADAADLYAESIVKKGQEIFYEYDQQLKPVTVQPMLLKYKENGMHSLSLNTYRTHHGPVMGSRNDHWLSLKEQNRSLNGLIQSWQRTKASGYASFRETMNLQGNHSTNTVFADDSGNIAYWHGNFIPVRANGYDWTQPVPGDMSATEWKGIHRTEETIHYLNPAGGFLQNCNSSPFSAAGNNLLNPAAYPSYMAPEGENFRSLYAVQELSRHHQFTLDSLIALGNDRYLAAFDSLLPPLLADFEALPTADNRRAFLQEPMEVLRTWDKRSSVSSVATTIAIEWGYALLANNTQQLSAEAASQQVDIFNNAIKNTPADKRLGILSQVISGLQKMFGDWRIPWGMINRFQRISGSVHEQFDDQQPSLRVGIASALFGSLAAYETRWDDHRKGYGVAGNSFVAVVEFGKRIRAKSIMAGGQSFTAGSKHFTDQAEMLINGQFKDVLFYKEDVLKEKESAYHPGE